MAGLPLSHIREGVQVPLYHLCTPKPLHHREPRGSCKGQHIAEGLAWGPQRCQEQWDVCLGTSGSSRSKRPADEAVSRGGGGAGPRSGSEQQAVGSVWLSRAGHSAHPEEVYIKGFPLGHLDQAWPTVEPPGGPWDDSHPGCKQQLEVLAVVA